MSLVLEARAEYDPNGDAVQVAIIAQNHDGTSLAASLATGSVVLRHGDHAVYNLQFGASDVRLVESSGQYQDIGHFNCFVLHPSAQYHLDAVVTISTLQGETARREIPITTVTAPRNFMQNPALDGVPPPDFPREVEKP